MLYSLPYLFPTYTPLVDSSLGHRSVLLPGVHRCSQVAHLGAVVVAEVWTTPNRKTAVDGRSDDCRQVAPALAQLAHAQPVDDRIQRALGVRQQVHVVDERGAAEVGAGWRVEREHLENNERHEERVQGQQKVMLKVIPSPARSQVYEMRSISSNKAVQVIQQISSRSSE